MGKRLKLIFFSPFWLALCVTVIAILLLPDWFPDYKVDLVSSGFVDKPGAYECYADVDHDENSERLILFNNTEGKATVKLMDQHGRIIKELYFRGKVITNPPGISTGICDTTGKHCIFIFTLDHDSIFLNSVRIGKPDEYLVKDLFITRIPETNGTHDFSLSEGMITPIDKAGNKGFVFSVNAGFSLQPRAVFMFDLSRKRLMHFDCGCAIGISDTLDVNHDGIPELLASTYSYGNDPDTSLFPYNDHSAWVMVFDHTLQLLFKPYEIKGIHIECRTLGLRALHKDLLISLVCRRDHGSGLDELYSFTADGVILSHKNTGDLININQHNLYVGGQDKNRLWMIKGNGLIEELNEHLNIIKTIHIKGLNSASYHPLNLNKEKFLLFIGYNQNPPMLVRDDFKSSFILPLPFTRESKYISVIQRSGLPDRIFIQSGGQYYILDYLKNPWAMMKYPVWMLIYIILLGFILLIRFIQRISLKQRYEAEKRIAGLQLLLLKNQLDPHFTFNALNSISASLLKDKPVDANENLIRLSRLMRASVEQNDRLSRSLGEELNFLDNYLKLIQNRMDEGFTYQIETSLNLDLSLQVPKMVTQIYVENAIKHGIRPLKANGQLIIRAFMQAHDIVIEVEDNGIGRKQSALNGSDGTGKGMATMEQFYEIFNRYNPHKIRYEIIDLEDNEHQAMGTKVRIFIPSTLKYRFYEG